MRYDLKKVILESLSQSFNQFEEADEQKYRLYEALKQVSILQAKQLNSQALKVIHHIKQEAAKFELYLILQDALQLELKMAAEADKDHYIERSAALREERQRALKCWDNYIHYEDIQNDCAKLIYQMQPGSKKFEEAVEKMLAHPSLSEKAALLSFRAKACYHNVRSLLFWMSHNPKADWEERNTLIQALDHIHWAPFNMKMAVYINFLTPYSELGELAAGNKTIERLERIEPAGAEQRVKWKELHIPAWVESKIQQQPIREILKKAYRSHIKKQ